MPSEELTEFRLNELREDVVDQEKRMDRCEQAVAVLVSNTESLVEEQKEFGKKLERWTENTEKRLTTLEVEQRGIAKVQEARKERLGTDQTGSAATGNGLTPPTPGTPAYYLAIALKYGGIPIGIAAGILLVIGGSIWILNTLGLI